MVAYEALIDRMARLPALAEAPAPDERLRRWSSADPNFRGNIDFGHFLRSEGAERVMAEADGSGAIVRIWSANPSGILRIYVDGGLAAALEADFAALLAGDVLPFAYPFAGTRGKGGNLYFPIPYRRSVKVTVESDDADSLYYHVEARRFAAGAQVPSFSGGLLQAVRPAIDRVSALLEAPDEPGEPTVSASGAVGADRPLRLRLDGPAAVRHLRVRFDAAPSRDVLRDLVLEIRWDGEDAPSVLVPLGDFFGTAPGANPFRSLPMEVRDGGDLVSRWYMPFGRTAEITIRNEGSGAPRVRLEAVTEPRPWTDTSLLFHASWRRGTRLEELALWPFAEIRGSGRYVGTMLSVYNPHPSWWGEGDEFITIDGEETPSILGTGTEDYFGYAWYATDIFSHAFHAQTLCEGPGNKGHTSVVRFHVIDDIPFQESFRGTFEIYWRFEPDYAATAYWYARPGGSKPPPLPPAEARRPLPRRFLGVFRSVTEALVVLLALLLILLWWRSRRPVTFGPRRRERFSRAGRSGRRRLPSSFTRGAIGEGTRTQER